MRINQPGMGRRALLAEGTAKAKAQRRERPWHSPGVEGRPLHVLSKGESRAGGTMWNMQGFEAGQGAGISSKRDGRLPRILCRSRTGGDFPLNGVPGSSVEIGSERGKREKQGGNQGATVTWLTSLLLESLIQWGLPWEAFSVSRLFSHTAPIALPLKTNYKGLLIICLLVCLPDRL